LKTGKTTCCPDVNFTTIDAATITLWGSGMISTINGHTYLLHDGHARTIEEAILWHGGEGERSKNKFMNLSKKEREQVLKFLESL
jgi:CxxC motif-containing protein (DUF1111 family)